MSWNKRTCFWSWVYSSTEAGKGTADNIYINAWIRQGKLNLKVQAYICDRGCMNIWLHHLSNFQVTTQRKQSTIGRKLAHSGHPANKQHNKRSCCKKPAAVSPPSKTNIGSRHLETILRLLKLQDLAPDIEANGHVIPDVAPRVARWVC
jgi:hypothetical protein